VLKVDGVDSEGQVSDNPTEAKWTKIDSSVALIQMAQFLVTMSMLKVAQPTSSIEDLSEDPNNPGTFYFATTGTAEKPGGDVEDDTDNATTPEEAENPYGRLYRFSLNPENPTGSISDFELVLKAVPIKASATITLLSIRMAMS